MLIQDRDSFEQLLSCLATHQRYACDTETFKSERWEDRKLMGIAWHFPGGEEGTSFYLPVNHQHDAWWGAVGGNNMPVEWLEDLRPYMEDPSKEPVFHNAGFDLKVLEMAGITVPNFFDTLPMAHLVNENRFSYELDVLGRDWFGVQKVSTKKIEGLLGGDIEGEGWQKIPPSFMGEYACRDVLITWKIFVRVLPELDKQGLWPVWDEVRTYVRSLAAMEATGLLVDLDRCRTLEAEGRARMAALEAHVGHPIKDSEVSKKLYTEAKLPVRSRTAKGKPQVNEDTLAEIAVRYPDWKEYVDAVLEYRGHSKAVSTWYYGFQRYLGSDNRIHPGFLIHGTKTGRLSCRRPNTQQIPRKGEVKKLFLAPPGYDLWELDYSQIELKLAAVFAKLVGKDPTMYDAYIGEVDLHRLTAENIGTFEYFPDDPDTARQVGKTTNFLLIYAGGPGILQATLWRDARMTIPINQCEKWHAGFHKLYPGIMKANQAAKYKAQTEKYVRLWNGRRRHFPDGRESRKAFNSVVQGGAGMMMMRSINNIFADPDIESLPVNTVHDSLWLYVPKSRAELEIPRISSIMCDEHTERFEIPITVDAKILSKGPDA